MESLPTTLPDRLAFVWSTGAAAAILVGLGIAFGFVDDNPLVTNPLTCTRCLATIFGAAWIAISVAQWASPAKKSKIRFGNLFKTLATMLITAFALHVFIVLFGAAATVDVAETLHLATLAASLGVWPCVLVCGPALEAWLGTVFAFDDKRFVGIDGLASLCAKGSLLGLWLGAVPIPLDWDRPWQRWPVTCVVGALLGHSAALVGHVTITCARRREKSF